VTGDTVVETDERFDITLSNPVHATIGTGSSYGYIINTVVLPPFVPIMHLLYPSYDSLGVAPDINVGVTLTPSAFLFITDAAIHYNTFGTGDTYGLYCKSIFTFNNLPGGDTYIVMLQGNYGIGTKSTGFIINAWQGGGMDIPFTWTVGVEYTVEVIIHQNSTFYPTGTTVIVNGTTIYTNTAVPSVGGSAPNGIWACNWYGNGLQALVKEVLLGNWTG
jgi:hypothetical protein